MNDQPHTHRLDIRDGRDVVYLTYGDQQKSIGRPWATNGHIRRVAKRMVRRHDRQSVKAGSRDGRRQDIARQVETFAEQRAKRWTATVQNEREVR